MTKHEFYILNDLYNGRQGAHNKAIQYACYLFYPAHMLILALLRMYL